MKPAKNIYCQQRKKKRKKKKGKKRTSGANYCEQAVCKQPEYNLLHCPTCESLSVNGSALSFILNL